MVSVGYFATLTGSFGAVKSSGDALEAQGIADVETNRLKLTDYSELDSNVQQGVWQDVPSNPEWQKFITIGPEKAFSGGKQRVADVSIRKKDDVQERFKLQVPLSQANDMVMEDGYIRMANGLIIQYGKGNRQEQQGLQKNTFKKPFTQCFFVMIGTQGYGSPDEDAMFQYVSHTKKDVTVNKQTMNGYGSITFAVPMYFAIGI